MNRVIRLVSSPFPQTHNAIAISGQLNTFLLQRGGADATAQLLGDGFLRCAPRWPGRARAGQTFDWAKQAGGPCAFPCGIGLHQASAIAVDGAGNSVVTGHITGPVVFGRGEPNETTLPADGQAFYIAKFDIHGKLLWAQMIGGDHRGQAIAVDAAGNSYVAGSFRFGAGFPDTPLIAPLAGVGDFFIAKFDPAGNFVWARQGGLEFIPGVPGVGLAALAIAVDSAGNSRLTGAFGTPTGGAGFFLASYDTGGSRAWVSSATENEANPGNAGGTGVALDAAGNSYVVGNLAGTTFTFGRGEPGETTLVANSLFVYDFFVAKYHGDGRLAWAKPVGGAGFDQALGIAADAAGHVHVTGTFDGEVTFGAGETTETVLTANSSDMFVARYDPDGGLEWARHAPGVGFGGGSAIAVDASGGIHVTGGFVASVTFGPGEADETVLSVDPGGSTNVFVAKYHSGGDLRWARAATGSFAAVGRAVAADTEGNTYITGDFGFLAPFGPSSLTFGLGEPNETTLTTEAGGELFVARYTNGDAGPINRSPLADAGADQTVNVGATVTLDGSGSSDPDLDQLTFQWTLTGRPANSAAVLQSDATATPTFVADVAGTYQASLVVRDGRTNSVPDLVVITTANRRPIADAGADQTATTGSTIQLNGSGSSDPDGDTITFAWVFVTTPPQSAAALSNPASVSPSFIADLPGTYVVQLVVSDGPLQSVADTVTITITPPESSVLGCGSLVSGTITARGEVDLYSFTGQAGQIISLALASAGGFTSSPSSRSVALRLFAPSGALVGTLLSNSQSLFTLPAGGVYAVRVSANNLTTTGSSNSAGSVSSRRALNRRRCRAVVSCRARSASRAPPTCSRSPARRVRSSRSPWRAQAGSPRRRAAEASR